MPLVTLLALGERPASESPGAQLSLVALDTAHTKTTTHQKLVEGCQTPETSPNCGVF